MNKKVLRNSLNMRCIARIKMSKKRGRDSESEQQQEHGVTFNRRYPIHISSLDSVEKSITLKFGFKPANILNTAGALLTSHQPTAIHEGKVEFKTVNDEGKEVVFNGNVLSSVSSSSQNHEFVLCFNREQHLFSLRPVNETFVNLRPKLDTSNCTSKMKKEVVDVRAVITQRAAKKAGGGAGKKSTESLLPLQDFVVENVSNAEGKLGGGIDRHVV
ncbi:hypothetical protein EON65_32320 [archaeon]|nr:MAG: hypothetical protein EON65_32320 [archaeon]